MLGYRLRAFLYKAKIKLFAARAGLIIFCVGSGIWLLYLIFPSITGKNLGTIQIGDEPFARNHNNITVFIDFHDLLQNSLQQDIHYISLPPTTEKVICIQDINFSEQKFYFPPPYDDNPFMGSVRGRGSRGGSLYEFENFCTKEHQQSITTIEGNQRDNRVKDLGRSNEMYVSFTPAYYYPFDRGVLDVNIWLSGKTKLSCQHENSVIIAPDIVGYVTVPEWDETITIKKEFSEEIGHDITNIHIDFRRPLVSRILTVILLAGLAIFAMGLAFINDISGFLQAAIAVLLGLWGIQDIIIPANLNEPTIITPIVLALYSLLAFSVFIRFVIRPVWRWFDTRYS